jgi:hypothetical protein
MSVVAVEVDGKWTPISDLAQSQMTNSNRDSDLIDVTPASDIDQIVAHLGQAVRLAQNLTPADARRARDFMHAAYSMLTATTYLPGQDQARFEHALREDVARMR